MIFQSIAHMFCSVTEKYKDKNLYYHKKDGSYLEDGYYMDLGNYALDFTVPHRFVKITPSGNVQLMESNMSSHREEKKIGKVKWDSGNQHWYIWVTYPNDAYSINI